MDAKEIQEKIDILQKEVSTVIKGKDEVIRKVIMAILASGHVLLEDVPGLGKTTLAKAFSKALGFANKRIHFTPSAKIEDLAKMAAPIVSMGNQTSEGWFLTGEMMELIHSDAPNIVCIQPFACLPNHIVGKGVIKAIRKEYPKANIVAIDYDPGASEVNQLNRIKLMLSTAFKRLDETNS